MTRKDIRWNWREREITESIWGVEKKIYDKASSDNTKLE